MTLSARGIALQGFALTPIALAVQGLIALLADEEQVRVDSTGGKNTRQRARSAQGIVKRYANTDLLQAVRDKWDAIEAAQKSSSNLQAVAPAKPDSHARRPASVTLSPKAAKPPQSGGIAPLYTGSAKQAQALVDAGQAATKFIASKASAAALDEIRQQRADEDAFILSLLLAAA